MLCTVKGYSTREVSELLQIPENRVRAFAREGFVEPGRGDRQEFRFSFQDIVLLRAARDLEQAQIPPRRVYRALRALRDQLPADRSLAAVRIVAVGDEVVVRETAVAWQPDSGQAVIDFDVATLAATAAPMVRHAASVARSQPDHDAEAWFSTAIDLELVGDESGASQAYERVLALEPEHGAALINLGRLHHDAGRLREAEALYQQAADADSDDALAWFNLGVVREDLARPQAAREAYERAVAVDPLFADAHFNLSRILERLGKPSLALKHLVRYRALLQGSADRNRR